MEKVINGECYRSVCVADGAEYTRVYGVRLQLESGRVLEMDDISDERETVARFAQRLVGESVDEVQLQYIAEDYLAEVYGRF